MISAHGCSTISQLFEQRVNSMPNKVALREKDFGIWNEYTWQAYGDHARWIGLGLKALGLTRGDVCSIASEVNKEWMFADMGIICIGGVTNGVYPTDAANQVAYLINDSQTRYYFAENEEQLDKVLAVRQALGSQAGKTVFPSLRWPGRAQRPLVRLSFQDGGNRLERTVAL